MTETLRSLGIRRAIATLSVAALLGAGGLAVFLGHNGSSASAGTLFSALARPASGPIAAEIPDIQALGRNKPDLDLIDARNVITDDEGTVWLTTTTDGDVCLIEKPAKQEGALVPVVSRFSCRTVADVAKGGIVAGVPGHWYGVAPDNFATPSVTVGGETTRVVTKQGASAFRLPADVETVTVGEVTYKLPPVLK
ncbi:MAG TPA: hypothetical protein VGM33_00495 [Baekduia sp.]